MKVWGKILSVLKYIGIVAGSVTIIWRVATFFVSLQNNIDNYQTQVMDTLSAFRKTMIDYQVKTNDGLESKTGQIGEIIKTLQRLDRNQKIIILKSDESQRILEEIKNQQLINGNVDINYLESKDAYIVQLKKKESE